MLRSTLNAAGRRMTMSTGWSESIPNFSGKLQRGSLRYSEAVQFADILVMICAKEVGNIVANIYGYIQVSTSEQNEDRQLIVLREMSIPEQNIFMDKQSGNVYFLITLFWRKKMQKKP